MARDDIEYVSFDHFTECQVKLGSVTFVGTLYQRTAGGFDLYLSLGECDVDELEQEKFNVLYNQADQNQEVFIAHSSESAVDKRLQQRASDQLKLWLMGMLGLPG